MNKEQLLALGLTEETADKVLSGFGHMVPKTRLDEVINEKNELKAQLSDRDTQLKELAKSNKDNEELQTQIKTLQDTNKKQLEEYQNKLSKIKLDNAIDIALSSNGAKNSKAVKALLNLEKVKLDNDNLIGLSEQLEALKNSDSYLFKDTTPSKPTGVNPVVANGGTPTKSLSEMTYDEIVAIMKQ